MPSITQQIIDLLASANYLLTEIGSSSSQDLTNKIDVYVQKQSEFAQKFSAAQKIFSENADHLSESDLRDIVSRIRQINDLLVANNRKIKDTTKQVEIDNLHQSINLTPTEISDLDRAL